MSKSEQISLAEGSIPRLLLKFSLPAIVGMLISALYNVIDSAFVGRGVGDIALAGVTVTFPLVMIMVAFIMLIAMGATSLISIRLGQEKADEAEIIIANALSLFLISGIILMVLGLIFVKPLLILFGASKEVLPEAMKYMRIILLGTIPMALGIGMNNFIRAEGNPKVAMITMLVGSITNIILDYIFLFIFKWGIEGAAIATVISYCITGALVIYYFISGNSMLKVKSRNLKINKAISKKILIVGLPAFAMQMTTSIQHLIINRSLVHYGGDIALAAIGILMSLASLLMMPAIGISQGAQPIIGFNYGAKKFGRVKSTLKLSIAVATGISTVGWIVSRLWASQLVGLFNSNPELIELGAHAMLVFFLFLPLISTQVITASYFQAVGKPRQSTIVSLSRQIIIFIPLVLVLPRFLGLEGIWTAAPISDLASFLFTVIWLYFELKSLSRDESREKDKISE